MAVEVVGEAAEEKLRVTCRHCSAVLEYVRSDIQVGKPVPTEFHGVHTVYSKTYFVDCPRCHRQVAAKR